MIAARTANLKDGQTKSAAAMAAASVSQPDAAKLLVEVSRLAQIWGMEPSAQIWADLGFRETRNPWLPRFGELYEAAVFPSEIALRQVLAGGVPKLQNGVADGRQRRGVGNLRVAEHGMEAAIPYPRDRGVDLGGIEVIQDCLDIEGLPIGCAHIGINAILNRMLSRTPRPWLIALSPGHAS